MFTFKIAQLFFVLIIFSLGYIGAENERSHVDILYELYPEGSKLKVIPFQDGTYFFEHFYELNWHQAADFCRSHGMQLLSVESQEEEDFIIDELETLGHPVGTRYHISGNDLGSNGTYVWGATGRKIGTGFTSWALFTDPSYISINGTEENCMTYRYTSNAPPIYYLWKWSDEVCDLTTYFICEMICDQTCTP